MDDTNGCIFGQDIVASSEQPSQLILANSSSASDANDTKTISMLHKLFDDTVLSTTDAREPYSSDQDYDSDPGIAIVNRISYKAKKNAVNSMHKIKYVKCANGLRKVSESETAIRCRRVRMARRIYIQTLESTVVQLRLDNDKYKSKIDALKKKIDLFSRKAVHLKAVLQNQCFIAKMFAAVSRVPGISVDSSVKCVNEDIANLTSRTEQLNKSGVCLHIYNDVVYLRSCSFCNISSRTHSSTHLQPYKSTNDHIFKRNLDVN